MQGEVFSVAKKTNFMDMQVRTDTPLSVCQCVNLPQHLGLQPSGFLDFASFVPAYCILRFERVLPSILELLNALGRYLND
jgi:hypothetical protein